ncbi:MAG TPA: WXG100 family type VII secretion target [Acidimicrobiia bacterium]
MESFSVDPGQLRAAVTEATRAVAGLEDARSRLDWANGHVQEGADDKAADEFDGFRKRWKDEFKIIGEFLTGMEKALTATAAIYEQVDAEIAAAVGPQP